MCQRIARSLVFGLLFLLIPIDYAVGTKLVITGRLQSEYHAVHVEGFSSQTALNDPTFFSSWGLRISENLGNGLKAIGMIDWGFSTGTGSPTGAREQYVAFSKDSLGILKFGRIHSLFADYIGGWTIDPLVYTALQAAGSGGAMIASANGLGSGAYTAVNSVLRFDSVNFNGFTFAAMLMPGDSSRLEANLGGLLGGAGNNIGNTGGANGEWDVQLGTKYEFHYLDHRLAIFGGYSRDNASSQQKHNPFAHLRTEEVGRIGGVWAYKNYQLQGQFERISNALGAATCSNAAALGDIGDPTRQCNSAMNPGGDGYTWFTSGQYMWGNTSFVAQGGMTIAHAVDALHKKNSENFTLGAIHNLSKRTSIFGGYQRVNVDDQSNIKDRDRNTWTVGIRHRF
ncbi:hypothetical protein W03_13040 [Nitrosomonas sp. PY1]|uniref:porin n=1 Tax=Nitrosomonas sp. PY1 TaxID=1803906 RepID=UPI001FC85704|nr:porin [Nitrosomonas sp. PY1]GKS69300.1 hypothetical protein W03_13040 [Nitrosomonas sp. PY1]